jgi:hypothetical protein
VELSNVSSGLGKITAAVFKSLKQKAGDMRGMTSGLGGLVALSKGNMPSQMIQPETQIGTLTPIQIAKIEKANPDTSVEDAAKAAELKKKAEDEAAALKKKAEDEAAAAKAAAEKTAKENAAKALAAAKQASEAKKAEAAAEAERKRKEEETAAEAERKRKEEEAEAERKRKEEEAAQAAQAATPRKQSALEALRNRKGSIGELSPEGQAKTGLLKTPGLGRGRTKPGRGRVGSTRRVGY